MIAGKNAFLHFRVLIVIPGDCQERPDPIGSKWRIHTKEKGSNNEATTAKAKPEEPNRIRMLDPILDPPAGGSCGLILGPRGPFLGLCASAPARILEGRSGPQSRNRIPLGAAIDG